MAWQKRISSPGKNDKRESNQKVGLKKKEKKKVGSRSLGERKNKKPTF